LRKLIALALGCFSLCAHVGVNDVFFEGLAGVYPLYVTIRPPVVIPGVAEITIRSAAKDVKGIRIAPMTLTGAGSKYPPTPDLAVQSKEDPQTFTGGLWIMSAGAWQVKTMVEGARGTGEVSVPVRAASQQVSTMDPVTGGVLTVLMILLAAGVVGIAGAAAKEAQLPPGTVPDHRKTKRGWLAMGTAAMLSLGVIWIGAEWWNAEAQDYSRSLYKPLTMQAKLNQDLLELQLSESGWYQVKTLDDFVADHGHLMHLYAIRESDLGIVYHLHPKFQKSGKFVLKLPEMAAGKYRLFADVVHKNGFPETLTSSMELREATKGPGESPDDAGGVLKGEGLAVLEPMGELRAGKPTMIRFTVKDADGNPAANLKPYLGMAAHLAVVKRDFSVFSHLHPNGNISMAAFEMAQINNLRLSNNVLVSSHASEGDGQRVPAEFGFPFGFPTSGEYLLILQFARPSGVETLSFDVKVSN